jgi:phosphatidylglycerophosphate synthase
MSWVLRLLRAADGVSIAPGRKVAGLSLPLRAALAAQAGGAARVELAPGAEGLGPLLGDGRLGIPVAPHAPRGPGSEPDAAPDLLVEMPWDLVVHRDLLRALAASGVTGRRNLVEEPFAFAPPFGFEPILVTDAASARAAETELLQSLRKPQDGWTATHLNRHISLALTRWLVKTPLRPNQLSVAILGVGILGAYLASRGTYGSMLAGAVLFQAQSVLDGCDGEMSRVTYRGSHLGEWLDTVGDDLTNYGFFGGTAWGLYAATGWKGYLVAGAVTVACGVIASAIQYRYLWSIGSGDLLRYPLGVGLAPGAEQRPARGLVRLLDAIQPLFKRDTFVLVTLFAAAAGLLGPMLIVFALGGIGIAATIVRAEMSRRRG